ncbi:MAG: hypothetical protein ACIAXF_12980 [Phycisphaerales bacterium JB063]
MKRVRNALWVVAGVLLTAGPAHAQQSGPADDRAAQLEAQREAARIDRLWNRAWREFAPYYLEYEGVFIYVPGYDQRLPSSVGLSLDDYQEQSAWEQPYTDERGRERTRTLIKPEDEAYAAVALLPAIAVGQYGYIHSGNIDRIEDGQTLMLSRVWFLDAEAARAEKQEMKEAVLRGVVEDIGGAIRDRGRNERRNRGDGIGRRRSAESDAIDWAFEDRTAAAQRQSDRSFARYRWQVVGYRTDRLEADARWPAGEAAEDGLQLIIVAVEGNRVTAVPAQTIGDGVSEVQFLDCLTQRGITKEQFVELVNEAKRESRSEYLPLVFAQLEGESADDTTGTNDSVELAD